MTEKSKCYGIQVWFEKLQTGIAIYNGNSFEITDLDVWILEDESERFYHIQQSWTGLFADYDDRDNGRDKCKVQNNKSAKSFMTWLICISCTNYSVGVLPVCFMAI